MTCVAEIITMCNVYVVLGYVSFFYLLPRIEAFTPMEDAALRKTLFAGYNKNVLKRNNSGQVTDIHVSLDLTSLLSFEERKGIFTTMCIIWMNWTDDALGWDPSDYGNLSYLITDADLIWTPKLYLSNPAAKMDNLRLNAWQVIVIYTKEVLSSSGSVLHTACDVDVTLFPFDSQYCQVEFGLYGVRPKEINITAHEADTSLYLENNAWILTRISVEVEKTSYLQLVRYTLTIERRYTFYILNLYSPVLILVLLNAMVFVIPADSGERIGYAITCMLSLSVYMTVATDNLPDSSKPLPIITVVLLMYVMISAFISMATIIGLNLHLHDNSNSPSGFLVKAFCLSRNSLCVKAKVTDLLEAESTETTEECKEKRGEASWRDIATKFDKFCFIFFNVSIFLLTFLYFLIVRLYS